MDPNGSRYHLLLSQHDWLGEDTTCTPEGGLVHDAACGLRLRSEPYRFPASAGDRAPQLGDRRGVGADRFHNLYWVDHDRTGIRVRSAGSGSSSLFWHPGLGATAAAPRDLPGDFRPVSAPPVPPPRALSGLAVTEDHYLVVGTRDPDGLLVIDLWQPASRTQEVWPTDVPFTPFDLCARTGGGVFVLDRDHRRLWELDGRLAVVARHAPEPPVPVDFSADDSADFWATDPAAREGTGAGPVRARIRETDAIALDPGGGPGGAVVDPWAVQATGDGRVLVLLRDASGPSRVRVVSPDTGTGPEVALVDGRDPDDPLAVVAHALARLVEGAHQPLGRVLVADAGGNQAYAFDLTEDQDGLHAELSEDSWPMRLFGGMGLVADGNRAWYDVGDGWVPLVSQARRRYVESATLRTRPLDGALPGTVWHRLLLDARIPSGCRVSVRSRAGDTDTDLEGAFWRQEPAFTYSRSQGSELAFEADEVTAAVWATWEVLLQEAEGRFLQLEIELSGDVRNTPWLRALRVYFPRFSYVDHYLPAVYQEDPASASFLTRYLANTEGTLSGIEARVATAQALFDPRTAPDSALGWLLGWFDLAADPTWGADRLRLFLRNATTFLGLRGTRLGIVTALRFALDDCLDDDVLATGLSQPTGPGGYRIVERFATRRAPVPLSTTSQRTVGVAGDRWDPGQGRDDLVRRWRAATGSGSAGFPLSPAAAQDQAAELGTDVGTWTSFVDRVLGINPVEAVDDGDWRQFLTDRYGRVQDLNTAYGLVAPTAYGSFEDVAAPAELPADGVALRDWYHYVAVVAPSRRGAHQFTVLLPVARSSQTETDAERRRAIASRVIELQKPAHTTFGIRFFWSAFQVGSAVLGQDTQVELGGRDPQFHQLLVLGRDYAGETSLGGPPAPTGGHVGRDRLSG